MEVIGQHHGPTALLPGKNPGSHWSRGCIGRLEEDVSLAPARIRTPDLPLRSLVCIPNTLARHLRL